MGVNKKENQACLSHSCDNQELECLKSKIVFRNEFFLGVQK
jgi:hypothetical protein